jgi:hypothetical protein
MGLASQGAQAAVPRVPIPEWAGLALIGLGLLRSGLYLFFLNPFFLLNGSINLLLELNPKQNEKCIKWPDLIFLDFLIHMSNVQNHFLAKIISDLFMALNLV